MPCLAWMWLVVAPNAECYRQMHVQDTHAVRDATPEQGQAGGSTAPGHDDTQAPADDPPAALTAVGVAVPSADDPPVAPAAVSVAVPSAGDHQVAPAAVSDAVPSADDPPVAPAAESVAMPETELPGGNMETISDNADDAGQVGSEPPLATTAPELTIASEVCTAD